MGYEPKTTRVLLSEMEQREAQETVGEGKSADEQLKAMMEATESSGLEPRPAEFLGDVTSAAARSSGSHSGDLLRGLIPAPTGGSVLGGLQPGVRRVEVVMPQGDREVAHVERGHSYASWTSSKLWSRAWR